jgi:hypothetical protein
LLGLLLGHLRRALAALTAAPRAIVVIVIVVRLQNLFTQLLLAFMNIRVEFVTVFADRELLIVVDRDVDLSGADGLVVCVVELGDVGMSESLICSQALAGVELEQTP